MKSEEIELLPCPFCGSEASMTQVESALKSHVIWIVGCNSENCDVSFHGHARKVDAKKAWNGQRAIAIIDDMLPHYQDARPDTNSWGALRAMEGIRQRLIEAEMNALGSGDNMNHDLQQLRSVLEERERIDPDAPKAIVAAINRDSPDTQTAFDTIKSAMQNDPDYAWSWHCNLAMCAVDEGVDHTTANNAARRFMQLCFSVEVQEPYTKPDASDGGGK